MSEHTPGPWKWWTSNSWRRLRSDEGHGHSRSVLEPYACRDGHSDCVVSEADMALIAAAPELLEALKAALERIPNEHDFDHTPSDDAVREQARAAIAKATSKHP